MMTLLLGIGVYFIYIWAPIFFSFVATTFISLYYSEKLREKIWGPDWNKNGSEYTIYRDKKIKHENN